MMRYLIFVIGCLTFGGMLSCTKPDQRLPACEYQHMAGVITGLSVPDSVLQHEKRELVVGVFTPGRCVGDIKVNLTPVNDSLYYLDADVAFNEDSAGSCDCKTGDQHFVRVFFTAPAAGRIVITTAPDISPGQIDTVVVY